MTWHEKVCVWRCETNSFLNKVKRYVWNKHCQLWWYRLWIRKDEFHKSLDMDADAMMEMDEGERELYLADLIRRRKKAHQEDLARLEREKRNRNFVTAILGKFVSQKEDQK